MTVGPRLHLEDDVVVRGLGRGLVVEAAGLFGLDGCLDAKPARHAEMHDERLAGRQLRDEVLRPPPQRLDARTGDVLHEPLREGKAQVRPP